jgi:hypothetical protein
VESSAVGLRPLNELVPRPDLHRGVGRHRLKVHPGIGRRALTGARIGLLTGLCLAAIYLALGAVGTTDFDKSLGYSLLLVGFPTLFAVVPALEWMGLQGGTYQGVAALLTTLCLNSALWGAVLGVALGLAARLPWYRRDP